MLQKVNRTASLSIWNFTADFLLLLLLLPFSLFSLNVFPKIFLAKMEDSYCYPNASHKSQNIHYTNHNNNNKKLLNKYSTSLVYNSRRGNKNN